MERLRRTARLVFGLLGVAGLIYTNGVNAEVLDDQIFTSIRVDQLEYRATGDDDVLAWELEAWAGTDKNKIAFESEGEVLVEDGVAESVETQLVYRRLISDFFDLKLGARYDFEPEPRRFYGVLGLEGLAPYWFEVDADLFLSEEADLSARLEVEYDLLITNELILQPLAEINVAASSDTDIGEGNGLRDIELGLRLRYEFTREFAPYVGVHWEKKFGETADFARDEGEDTSSLFFLAGVRLLF